jgi:hypothetical protein
VAVWDSLDNIPAYASEVALLEQTAGRQAADALRAPFVLDNREDLATLFSEAGVSSAEITAHHGTAQFPSIRTMVEADLRGWLPLMGVILAEDKIRRILEEAEQALSPYATADGRAAFPIVRPFRYRDQALTCCKVRCLTTACGARHCSRWTMPRISRKHLALPSLSEYRLGRSTTA